jgi:hypothetical protein
MKLLFKGGHPQISYTNRKSPTLRTKFDRLADLPQVWICDLCTQSLLGGYVQLYVFCELICDLRT